MSYTKLTDFASKDALLTGNPSKLVRGTELGAEFDAIEVADALNIKPDTVTAATAKTTPVDADLLTLFDSASTFSLKKLTWVNVKATLKTYFDTIYVTPGANSSITSLTGLTTPLSVAQGGTGSSTGPVLRSYLTGLTLSTAGSSATMSIAAGVAMDSTATALLTLASAYTKTGTAWAVGTGNGGIDTGSFTSSTWYHFYLIRRPDTGVVDVIFSLSASAPTLPANYTQYRRIGSAYAVAGVVWRQFVQNGDYFEHYTSIFDVGVTNPGTAAVLAALSVPTGLIVEAVFNGGMNNTSTGTSGNAYFSNPAKSDEAPSSTATPLWGSGALASNGAGGATATFTQQRCTTNTSAQIRYRCSASDANMTIRVATHGWIDTRGRNA